MKKLTFEYALKNKMTFIDLVRYFNPDWDDEKCDFYLWEFTPHPCCGVEYLIELLNNRFIKNSIKKKK